MAEAEDMGNEGVAVPRAAQDTAQDATRDTTQDASEREDAADPTDTLTARDAACLSDLRGKLARYPGPAYRKAYLANLVESGKRFLISGNSRAAAYCLDKVSQAIASIGETGNLSDETESPASGSAGAAAASDSATGEPSGPAKSRKPNPARPRAKVKSLTPTELFRRNWCEERIQDAEQVLNRHGGRLSALENKAYRERLDKLRQSALTATGIQSDRVDAGLLDLRRRLYSRVLKSQKIGLKRSRMPMTLARLALPPASRGLQPPASALPTTRPPPARTPSGKAPAVQVDTAWQPVVGPYNDRYNMEDLLTLIADADAAWVEEFLDLYRGLSGLQNLMVSISALKKI